MESQNIVSSYCTVLCQNTQFCYLMIGIEHGILKTSVHVGCPSVLCSSTVLVSVLFTCCSALTTVVWTHDVATSLLCFLKFRGCDMLGLILTTTSGISYNGCMFVFSVGGAVQNSPPRCRLYFIYR